MFVDTTLSRLILYCECLFLSCRFSSSIKLGDNDNKNFFNVLSSHKALLLSSDRRPANASGFGSGCSVLVINGSCFDRGDGSEELLFSAACLLAANDDDVSSFCSTFGGISAGDDSGDGELLFQKSLSGCVGGCCAGTFCGGSNGYVSSGLLVLSIFYY